MATGKTRLGVEAAETPNLARESLTLEGRIRRRAYEIWLENGDPLGQHGQHQETQDPKKNVNEQNKQNDPTHKDKGEPVR